ncbi:hypothetical protein Q1695_014143 [Nippostrongylus brasiliensis]|nr:hypothetical protein Q1695_014143 [Nippostrongylus brasiliensis]
MTDKCEKCTCSDGCKCCQGGECAKDCQCCSKGCKCATKARSDDRKHSEANTPHVESLILRLPKELLRYMYLTSL